MNRPKNLEHRQRPRPPLERTEPRTIAERVCHYYDVEAIAGGFVRDAAMGKMPKDIDLYTHRWDTNRVTDIDWVDHSEHEHYQHPYIKGLVKTEWTDNGVTWPVEIIIIKDGLTIPDVVNSFDIGLCMAYWTPKTGTVLTNKFKYDRDNKVLTRYRHEWGKEGHEAHVKRLLEKYPDFTYDPNTELPFGNLGYLE